VGEIDASGASAGESSAPRQFRSRLIREVRSQPRRSIASEIGIGILAALLAVGVRYVLPLSPDQLPTLTIVVTLAIVTTFVGVWAGIATALVGGVLSWYLLFNPFSLQLTRQAELSMVGFTVISAVIVTTSQLYRSSERRHHEHELSAAQRKAQDAELFAREMAHRLKNALAIVQAIAFQTIGADSVDARSFGGRLKALADANELLSEHVQKPTAGVRDVIMTALEPFSDGHERFRIESPNTAIPAQQVVSLALALHELGTNASKYGALATNAGTVTVIVKEAKDRLNVSWKELGGPEVTTPAAFGFGTRLLRRSGMDTELEFEGDGLRCSFGIRKS